LPERFKKIRDNLKLYHSPNFYRRFSRDEINGTITASAQPENCGILHPIEHRRYTVREIARIQSFPDNFIFNLQNIQNSYKVIGNAVPPKMAEHIALAIKNQIFS
jgi:DNA (cytosine-5)-methyltransferase 1